jgi:acylphosphatase
MTDPGQPPTTDRVRRRVIVHGRVQGVFFRAVTEAQAQDAGVAGWVRNRPDGSVEAVFEGAADAVAELVEFCRRGPRHARVLRVELFEEPPEDLRGFRVVR